MKIAAAFMAIICLPAYAVQSPPINCTQFKVQHMRQHLKEKNTLELRIRYTGKKAGFINYPHVALIKNSKGDTLATGSLGLYGQMANTTDEFKVILKPGQMLKKGNYTIYFKYNRAVCLLPYEVK